MSIDIDWLGVDVGWVHPAVDSDGRIYHWSSQRQRAVAEHNYTQASDVTIRRTDGTVTVEPALHAGQIADVVARADCTGPQRRALASKIVDAESCSGSTTTSGRFAAGTTAQPDPRLDGAFRIGGTMANSRGSRRYRKMRDNLRAQRRPCCLCGEPIDYSLEWPDPGSFSVEHTKPWSTNPEAREDPTTFDAAHLGCNSSKGNQIRRNTDLGRDLGRRSRDW